MELPISASELAAKLKTADAPFLLDVREPEEHAFAALPDSKLIPLGQIGERAGELDAWKDKEIVVYCHHGIRSQHAIARLRTLGFTKLRNLSGGIDAWSREVNAALPRY
jgi:sulfur-carrier protein adenylyltransferase/sulfurtransferase